MYRLGREGQHNERLDRLELSVLTSREHSTCAIFIQRSDVAGALRLQHQISLPICAIGAGYARANRTNGMLPTSISQQPYSKLGARICWSRLRNLLLTVESIERCAGAANVSGDLAESVPLK
jgi:hypothetical protein